MEKLNLAQAISLLESDQNFGSIYTKQDVLMLLNRIETAPQENNDIDIDSIVEDIENEICSIIDNLESDDCIEYDTASFRLDGNEIELYSVDLNTYNIRDAFSRLSRDIKHQFTERRDNEN